MTDPAIDPVTGPVLGIVLAGMDPARVHAAFSMAAAGAAIGRRVVLLATGPGCRALATGDPFDAGHTARLAAAGVAGPATLRDAVLEMGGRLLACEASLRLEPAVTLHPGVSVAGMATFLMETGPAPIVSF